MREIEKDNTYLRLKVGVGEGLHSFAKKQFSFPCPRKLSPPRLEAGGGGSALAGLPGH